MELRDENLYYVGGIVRDRLLNQTSLDADYCYEGNAIEFAEKSGLNIIKINQDFGTVRILSEDEQIDIASARTESYPRKGHLPVVKEIGVPLEEDLKRRDFAINAMAQRTTDGGLIDPLDGKKDIENKLLRVLHKDSFIDDPSRIIRGLKFSVRFGFELEAETKRLQDEYLNNINYDMSYYRLKKELAETFNLNKQKAYEVFIESGMYKLLGKNQKVPKQYCPIESIVSGVKSKYSWLVYLGLFDLSNLELTRTECRIIEWAERLKTEKPNNNTPPESILIHKIRTC